jgi:hypothetical protein
MGLMPQGRGAGGIGVSAYRLLEKLPAKLKGSLPTVEELEAELGER